MDSIKWMDEVQRRARTDEWYQVWQQDVGELEPAFLSIRDTLTQEQQKQLDDYISAREGTKAALMLIAYNLGREHGR